MLPHVHRLRRMRDFALLSQRGRVVYERFFTLRIRASKEPTKIGFVITTKIFKRANKRNRIKRRLREVLRLNQTSWPKNMDLLFIAKPEALKAPFEDLTAAVLHAFTKIPEALTKPVSRRPPKAKRKTSVVFNPPSGS